MSSENADRIARLQALLPKLGFPSVAAFAKTAGLPQQTVNSQLKRRRLSEETISAISLAGGSADWLLTGEGSMLRGAAAPEGETAEYWRDQAQLWKATAQKLEERIAALEGALGEAQATAHALVRLQERVQEGRVAESDATAYHVERIRALEAELQDARDRLKKLEQDETATPIKDAR